MTIPRHAERPAHRRPAALRPLVACLLAACAVWPAQPAAARGPGAGADEEAGWAARRLGAGQIRARDRGLLAALPEATRVGYHPETNRVRSLSGTRARPLSGGVAAVSSGLRRLTTADARARARSFVDRYGRLFGLAAPRRELRLATSSRHALPAGGPGADAAGPSVALARTTSASRAERPVTVRFDQVRGGVPVMGGQLAVQVSEDGAVLSASGEVMPSGTDVVTRPRIRAARARTTAAAWVARELGRATPTLSLASEGLAFYDPRIMDDPVLAVAGPRLVWRIGVQAPASARRGAEDRLILVDALSGDVLTSIARNVGVKRFICDNRSRPGRSFRCDGPYARTEGRPATRVRDVDAAYRLLGVVAAFLDSRFGRDGLDGDGARMKATVRYCQPYGCPWRNAEWKWHEQQAVFGTGWAKADDIVAHELAHGLLDHEVPLFYQYQSGAINESMADVFGELIDLSYSGGTDTAASAWRIGEDSPIGAFRDMQTPGRHGHPDRVRSRRWQAGSSDDGGVHRNSGVGNKAAYLIAEGGRFNGRRIKGIGRTRTARLYYQAITTRLTPAANYVDLADALMGACTDLVGTFGFLPAHCAAVRGATQATQMHLTPRKGAPRRAPLCSAGRIPVDVLFDDLEHPGSDTWDYQRLAGRKRGWYYPQNPNNDPAWDGTWASSGRFNFYAPDRANRSDTVMRLRHAVSLPAGAYLRFEHGYSFDAGARRRYDGGVVEIKVGKGRWRSLPDAFTHGGYNGRITRRTGNPLAGKRAFTGDSRGWSSARMNLSAYAGKPLKVRFRAVSDRHFGGRGWYIDDIRIYTCARDGDRPTGSVIIEDGAATATDPVVRLSLTWSDPTTAVTQMRLSGSRTTDKHGRLTRGLSMPVRDTYAWDLADTTFGGSGRPGTRRVFGQVRDGAGRWSDVFGDSIELLP